MTEFVTYDELDKEAKETAFKHWCTDSNSVAHEICYDVVDEDISSARNFFESIGAKLTDWSIGAYEPSFMDAEPAHGHLMLLHEAYYLSDLDYGLREMRRNGDSLPDCPMGKSDGYFVGEGLYQKWIETFVPRLDNLVAKANAMIANDPEPGGEARYESLLGDMTHTIDDGLKVLCDMAVEDCRSEAETVYTEEYFEEYIEGQNNDVWFEIDGTPTGW